MMSTRPRRVNERTLNIVNGYMRGAQILLPYQSNPYFNIPALIVNLCLGFYNNPEYFTVCNEGLKLKDEEKVIDSDSSYDGTCYGYVDIMNDTDWKYVWTFKIIKYPQWSLLAIGIDASDKAYFDEDFHDCDNESHYYGFEIYCNGSGELYTLEKRKGRYGVMVGDGDVIKMDLNVNDKTLKYYINDQDQGIAFTDVYFDSNTIYHMAVYVDNVDIAITDFDQAVIRQ